MKKTIGIVIVLAACLLFLSCIVPVLLDLFVNVAAGWALFLWRVVPEISLSWDGVLTATFCLVGLSTGLHFFFRWLYREMRRQPDYGGSGVSPGHLSENEASRTWPPRWTAMLLALVVLMFLAGVSAVGVTHQTAWLATSPEPLTSGTIRAQVERIRSMNNLREIALGAHAFHEKNEHFPPGGTFDAEGRALHGWQTLILPYVEEETLYKQINLTVPWIDPANAPNFRKTIKVYAAPYTAPAEDDRGFALTDYAGNARLLGGDVPWSIRQITDGTSNTLLMGEAAGNYKPWGDPTNWRDPALGINRTRDGFGSPSTLRGATFAFADGSARFLDEKIDPQVLKALSTPAGGEPIPDF